MGTKVTEKIVSYVWSCQLVSDVVTDMNEQLIVIYPGRKNTNSGCDFVDAIIKIDGRMIRGNVEIHVKSGDWYRHRHHRDHKYNGVT